MIDVLKAINQDFGKIEESAIAVGEGRQFWHCTILLKSGLPLGSGFKEQLNEARRVACAEFIERSCVYAFARDRSVRRKWSIDDYPSGCGFAVGFEREKTVVRSLIEAVERWVMTNWIIDQLPLEEVRPSLSGEANYLLNPFEKVRFFVKSIPFMVGRTLTSVYVGIALAYKEGGVYLGSNASTDLRSLWTHACLESHRHYLCVKNFINIDRFPFDRVFYFSKNAKLAEEQIPNWSPYNKWPEPKIEFFRLEEIQKGIFIARTIINGFQVWSKGPKRQFLY